MVKSLHKIKRIKRYEGVMSFTIFGEKYVEEIDYSLLTGEQISKILDRVVYYSDNGDLFVTNN